jgi:hypothetical protein
MRRGTHAGLAGGAAVSAAQVPVGAVGGRGAGLPLRERRGTGPVRGVHAEAVPGAERADVVPVPHPRLRVRRGARARERRRGRRRGAVRVPVLRGGLLHRVPAAVARGRGVHRPARRAGGAGPGGPDVPAARGEAGAEAVPQVPVLGGEERGVQRGAVPLRHHLLLALRRRRQRRGRLRVHARCGGPARRRQGRGAAMLYMANR